MVQPGWEVREPQPPWITRVTVCKTVGRRGSRPRYRMPKSESGRRCGTSPATRAATSAGPDTSRSVSSAASSPILAAATGMSPPPAAETSPAGGPDQPGHLADIALTSEIASAFLLGPATDLTSGFTRSGRCLATNAPSLCPTTSAAHMRPRRVMVQGGKQLICAATRVDTAQLDHCAVQRGVGEERPRQLRTAWVVGSQIGYRHKGSVMMSAA